MLSTMTKYLQDYIESMSQHGVTCWAVGWEAANKYVGATIYNYRTKQKAFIGEHQCAWDGAMDPDTKKPINFVVEDFRHGNRSWIYEVGEKYDRDYTTTEIDESLFIRVQK